VALDGRPAVFGVLYVQSLFPGTARRHPGSQRTQQGEGAVILQILLLARASQSEKDTKDKPSGLGGFLWRKRNDRVFQNAVKQAAQLSAWIMEEGLRGVAAGLAEFIQ
jgi:hypothetical protein